MICDFDFVRVRFYDLQLFSLLSTHGFIFEPIGLWNELYSNVAFVISRKNRNCKLPIADILVLMAVRVRKSIWRLHLIHDEGSRHPGVNGLDAYLYTIISIYPYMFYSALLLSELIALINYRVVQYIWLWADL